MDYYGIMKNAAEVFNNRNPQYGDMRVGMENVAQIATIITGIQLSAHDVALVLHAVKLSRLCSDRKNPDHYIDGVNYMAFAGELITEEDPHKLEQAMHEMAATAVNEREPESEFR
jgi:hypothetical protein